MGSKLPRSEHTCNEYHFEYSLFALQFTCGKSSVILEIRSKLKKERKVFCRHAGDIVSYTFLLITIK